MANAVFNASCGSVIHGLCVNQRDMTKAANGWSSCLNLFLKLLS